MVLPSNRVRPVDVVLQKEQRKTPSPNPDRDDAYLQQTLHLEGRPSDPSLEPGFGVLVHLRKDGVANDVVVRKHEREVGARRAEGVDRRVLEKGGQQATREEAQGAHLVDEFGLARPTKDGENLQEDVDDGCLAKERGETGDEVVKVSNRDAPNFGVLVAAFEENLANFLVD